MSSIKCDVCGGVGRRKSLGHMPTFRCEPCNGTGILHTFAANSIAGQAENLSREISRATQMHIDQSQSAGVDAATQLDQEIATKKQVTALDLEKRGQTQLADALRKTDTTDDRPGIAAVNQNVAEAISNHIENNVALNEIKKQRGRPRLIDRVITHIENEK